MSSTLNPAIILGGQPVQPQNALQTISQISQLKNAQQENQLRGIQMQGALQENQQRQLQLDQTKALNDAYMSAVNPDGSIDTGKLTDALSQGGHGSAIPSVLKGIQDYQKSTADTVEAKTKAATAQADHGGAIGSAVLAAGGDPHLAMSLVTSGLKSGTIDPSNAQQILGHMQQLMTADPTGEQAKQFALKAAKGLVDQSPAQQELALKKQTADAAKLTAETKQKAEFRDQATADLNKPKLQADADLAVAKSLGQRLSAARDVGTYQSIFDSLDEAGKQKALALGFTDPSGVKNVRDLMAATKAAGDLTKSAHERTEEAQRNLQLGNESANTAIRRQELGVQMYNAGLDASGKPIQHVDSNGNATNIDPIAQAIANYKLPPASARSYTTNRGLMEQVMAANPNFDIAQYETRQKVAHDFANDAPNSAGGQVLSLNTLIHHADLYQKTAAALKNGTFTPGNAAYNAVAQAFGSAPPTNANLVARFLAGETAKAAGGNQAEGEINGILKSLQNNASPDQIKQAGDTILNIAAGRMGPLKEKAAAAKLDGNVVKVVGPEAAQILQRNGRDPDTLQPIGKNPARNANTPSLDDIAKKHGLVPAQQ